MTVEMMLGFLSEIYERQVIEVVALKDERKGWTGPWFETLIFDLQGRKYCLVDEIVLIRGSEDFRLEFLRGDFLYVGRKKLGTIERWS